VLKFERYGLGLIKGMWVTIRHFGRHAAVSQYPEQRLNVSRRIRGNELVWSREKCTGCATCAKSCPQGAIEIITSTNLADNKYDVTTYRVDTGYCIQCGLCVEACPYDALFMGYSYERARYRRGELVQADDALLESPQRPRSGYFNPDIATKLPEQTLLIEKVVEKRQ
jgi:formate hydrogenlyase subunit 6/NADH:ubiquinone oxidoreductase subunit I